MTFDMNAVLSGSVSEDTSATMTALMQGSSSPSILQDGSQFQCPVEKLTLYHNEEFKQKTGRDQPYKILSKSKLDQLRKSIEENGLLEPLTVRVDPSDSEKYQILAGRNRYLAITSGNLMDNIKCIYRKCDTEDDARKIIIDTNEARRDTISDVERAFAISFRFDSIKELNTGKELGKPSDEIVAEEFGLSATSVHNYVQITHMIPEFQDMMEEGKIAVITGAHLGNMSSGLQEALWEAIDDQKKLPDKIVKKVADAAKNAPGGLLSATEIEDLLAGPPEKSKPRKYNISKEYKELIPKSDEMEDFFIDNYIKNALKFYSEFLEANNKVKNLEEEIPVGQITFDDDNMETA